MSLKKAYPTLIVAMGLIILVQGPGFATGPFTVNPAKLGKLRFEAPESQAAKSYLGIRGNKAFTLSQIAAKTLIVQVFSMYCPHCQADAPEVNKLYQRIQENSKLKNNVRIIGIGVGNTTFEVNLYKKKFHVPFPVFPDEDFAVEKACSEKIRTPSFIVVTRDPKRKQLTTLLVRVGKIVNAETFLKRITHAKKR